MLFRRLNFFDRDNLLRIFSIPKELENIEINSKVYYSPPPLDGSMGVDLVGLVM